ncbi:MAG: type VI secretion system baseplate subunit TssK [Burkholderia sp.]|jgi:type VI secretion system protein ImpJ|uniref:Type VI secretion protein n=1 Tax=Burkholderia arboris TaxID=488730 RepID=A0A9Q9UT13_9BURK|nr:MULTISPECIES: type VI secretion system baseplate subunit TssK [Burkholderia]ALX13163.1 type VI secretion protein [Burkholderia cepacia JBK9]MBY8608247.1 type VI secretion system baseplate subunit TssK [Burkholderia arboris]MCA3781345.1 type VI secretion system baseplate subunit TssK [Burkholderia sp.]MCA3783953.1 type VI secretion system baseplate subunit TssK [Burkholderia sp.]MCA3795437.1 type VI secretion system baseplate subunit TssK [Burkholderia sp.]
MSYSAKVLWGEGLFLRPQHFQRQDAYHEARLFESIQAIQPYNWGVRSVRIDRDALGSNVLRVAELALVFPDGALYAAPQADDLPPPIALDTLPEGINEFVFYLALHPLRENGTNYSDDPAAGFMTRFASEQTSVADNFTDAAEADITFLKTQVKLIAHSEPRDQLLSVPLVRVRRTATSGFEIDDSFVPPCLAIDASPILHQRLRQLIDALQAKVNALYGFHREPSKNIIEFRSGDIASFWLLHTANAAFATLAHLHQHAALHPERLFQELLRLAGQLMTFSKGYALADLPVYRHDDPGPSFARLDLMLRELLDTVISTRYFAITLDEVRPSFHLGRLDSGKIDDKTEFYLAVSADMPSVELVDAVPARFKVGAPDDVDKLVLSAMPGVRLSYTPQVPPAIPVRPGACYFALDSRSPLYERMLQAQSAMIYAPTGINDLKFELIAVTS